MSQILQFPMIAVQIQSSNLNSKDDQSNYLITTLKYYIMNNKHQDSTLFQITLYI